MRIDYSLTKFYILYRTRIVNGITNSFVSRILPGTLMKNFPKTKYFSTTTFKIDFNGPDKARDFDFMLILLNFNLRNLQLLSLHL